MSETHETPETRLQSRGRSDRGLRTVGWTGLAGWAAVGLALEAGHGLKLSAYLDDELTRLLLTLAHAHGAALSLMLVLLAHHGAPLLREGDTTTQRLALFAWAALPLGFALASIGHPESDPGLAIWLVPPAGLALVAALARVAYASLRAP
jgi:hypothetical protein